MCVILWLKPNQMPKIEQVENATYNNWHSLGLIVRLEDGLDITHLVPENGELDPKVVYDLLSKHNDKERILHLRHTTAGATNLENCHPFKVYSDKKKSVWFMHNGTMHAYKSMKASAIGTSFVEDPDGKSDTQNFADDVLKVMLGADFGGGVANIHNLMFQKTVNKWWPSSNRGILISSDAKEPWLIDLTANPWKKIKGRGDVEFLASNDDYFDRVIRGPEHARRLVREEEAKKLVASANSNSKSGSNVVKMSDYLPERHPFYSLSGSPAGVLNDWEFYNREYGVAVGYLTRVELETAQKEDPSGFISLCDWLFTDYAQLYKEYQELDDKHKVASKMIATLKTELSKKENTFGSALQEIEEKIEAGSIDEGQKNVG